ncbi:DNA topoisomerase 3-alpha [Dispira simplex]|nr:DNA topoisomerase 3-alpha [Dispira simplex]
MRILIVAEKPSQAKEISQILSEGQRRTRRSRGCTNYDFTYYFRNQACEVTVTSVAGHLMSVDFEKQYAKWRMVDPIQLFEAPIYKQITKNYESFKKNLEAEVRGTNLLIIWTDYDREGESIGDEIIQVCRAVKPQVEVLRAKFSNFTPEGIHSAMRHPIHMDYNLVAAVDARLELDLRIGSSLTRFQTLNLAPKFKEMKDMLLSYGPCQFPTLGFVVDQYLKVENFVPETFWTVDVCHTKDEATAKFLWKRKKLFDRWACLALYDLCLDRPTAYVTKMVSRPTSKWKPLPLTTVEMLTMASKFLKLSSDKTMEVAEQLYNRGIISYPRTETDQFGNDFQLKPILEKLTLEPNLGGYARRLLDGEFRPPRIGKNNDNAHPPIHPTQCVTNLRGDEKKLYELIVRRFIATCWEHAKGHKTSVTITIAGEKFSCSGLMVLAKNYLEVYPYERWNDQTIPIFQEGTQFVPTSIEMSSGTTSAPLLLSEHELIQRMQKNGIGTDATIPEHIKKIQEREYAFKQRDSRFCPSTLGVALVEGYDNVGFDLSLTKPYLRCEMEQDMKDISAGRCSKEEVVRKNLQRYRDVYEKTAERLQVLESALSKHLGHEPDGDPTPPMLTSTVIRNCPQCSNTMVLRVTANNRPYIGCLGYPQCRSSIWFPNYVTQVKAENVTCTRCDSPSQPVKLVTFEFPDGSLPLGYTSPPAVLRVTKKEGPNKDRSFYSCSKPMDDRCSFFQWADQPIPPQDYSPSSDTLNAFRQHLESVNGDGADRRVQCHCGRLATQNVVLKEGENQGRPYFKCSKSYQPCKFFQWADESVGNFGRSTMSSPIGLANGGTTRTSSSASRVTTSQSNPNVGSDWMASAQCYVCNEVSL